MSPLIDVKMEPDTVQHLEGIARFFIFRLGSLYVTHQFISGKVAHITGLFGELIFISLWIVMNKFGIKEKPIDPTQKRLIDKSGHGFTL